MCFKLKKGHFSIINASQSMSRFIYQSSKLACQIPLTHKFVRQNINKWTLYSDFRDLYFKIQLLLYLNKHVHIHK